VHVLFGSSVPGPVGLFVFRFLRSWVVVACAWGNSFQFAATIRNYSTALAPQNMATALLLIAFSGACAAKQWVFCRQAAVKNGLLVFAELCHSQHSCGLFSVASMQ